MAKATHEVTHKRLYLAVDGQLQHFPAGKMLTLTQKQEAKMGSRVRALSSEQSTDMTSNTGTQGSEQLLALKARAAELNIEGSSRWGIPRLTEEIQKAEDGISAGSSDSE